MFYSGRSSVYMFSQDSRFPNQLVVPGLPQWMRGGEVHACQFLLAHLSQHLQALHLCQIPQQKKTLRTWLPMHPMDLILYCFIFRYSTPKGYGGYKNC